MQRVLDAFVLETHDHAAIRARKVVVVGRELFAEFNAAFETVPYTVHDTDSFEQSYRPVHADFVYAGELSDEFGGGERLRRFGQCLVDARADLRYFVAAVRKVYVKLFRGIHDKMVC